ncbi:MAG: NAD(P)-dependent oxidoreductase [Christensenellales bacterium]
MKIGWIGIGNMGGRMAKRLMDAGYELLLYDIEEMQMSVLRQSGAEVMESPKHLAQQADYIFSTIPNSDSLRAITYGERGILKGMQPGTIVADFSTVDADTSCETAAAIEGASGRCLRCPVSGSTAQAEKGSLVMMVSGDASTYQEALPILKQLCEKSYYMGSGEQARHMKLVVNLMIGAYFQSYAEALVLGERAGLDWHMMIDILAQSSVSSVNMRNKAENFKKRDFSPMFTVRNQLKDINLILDLARKLNVSAPVTSVAAQYYHAMVATGRGELDYSSVLLVNEENNGIKWDDADEALRI